MFTKLEAFFHIGFFKITVQREILEHRDIKYYEAWFWGEKKERKFGKSKSYVPKANFSFVKIPAVSNLWALENMSLFCISEFHMQLWKLLQQTTVMDADCRAQKGWRYPAHSAWVHLHQRDSQRILLVATARCQWLTHSNPLSGPCLMSVILPELSGGESATKNNTCPSVIIFVPKVWLVFASIYKRYSAIKHRTELYLSFFLCLSISVKVHIPIFLLEDGNWNKGSRLFEHEFWNSQRKCEEK